MNKSNLKQVTFLLSTVMFSVLAAGFSPNQTRQNISEEPTQEVLTPVVQKTVEQAPSQGVPNEVSRLLQTKQCAGCNLTGANLKGADLDQANLQGANLQRANLQNADLEEALLEGCKFTRCKLKRALI